MATQTSLNDLIEALAGAVVDAQDRIEQHQVAQLSQYFDEDNRPKSVVIRMPSMHPAAQPGDEDFYRAPILPLVSTNLLRIKDVEIQFDADLGSLVDRSAAEGAPADAPQPTRDWRAHPAAPKPRMQIDTTFGATGKRAGAVHVVLRVEACEPTEGAARLMNHLTQVQGVFHTSRDGDDTPP
ncbi:Protein of unknown function [Luteibacter sp. UNCMF331Sha3.1]|uniref:DUF2589 domain-containing protein n=1 Tax=Luteibacter sp. UNCMF331Sha3.1 TaxID=1502760 RepID=UPI0008C9A93A|nr:DUF2589 domain-containing protein [Luteibacter sp. UNCMF331Sha3.1]SEN42533.1 Protein of unknown function [Luteibacter sp. UNCMF331Sha3.1]